MPAGRYAPSPTGTLHLGNLRTAIVAWLAARASGRDFWLRIEDLDRVRSGAEAEQLTDLRAVGLEWDAAPVRQSERSALYEGAVAALRAAHGPDAVYECFCSRKDIAQAGSAPQAGDATDDDDAPPAPLRPRRTKQASSPCARWAPAIMSTMDRPMGTGPASALPLSQVQPDTDCSSKSWPGLARQGPSEPKPEISPYTTLKFCAFTLA